MWKFSASSSPSISKRTAPKWSGFSCFAGPPACVAARILTFNCTTKFSFRQVGKLHKPILPKSLYFVQNSILQFCFLCATIKTVKDRATNGRQRQRLTSPARKKFKNFGKKFLTNPGNCAIISTVRNPKNLEN